MKSPTFVGTDQPESWEQRALKAEALVKRYDMAMTAVYMHLMNLQPSLTQVIEDLRPSNASAGTVDSHVDEALKILREAKL